MRTSSDTQEMGLPANAGPERQRNPDAEMPGNASEKKTRPEVKGRGPMTRSDILQIESDGVQAQNNRQEISKGTPVHKRRTKGKVFSHQRVTEKILERRDVPGYSAMLMEAAVMCDFRGFTFDTGHPSWRKLVQKVDQAQRGEDEECGKRSTRISDENRESEWMRMLQISEDDVKADSQNSSEIALDLKNQRVVHMDAKRTRQDILVFREEYVQKELEAILTLCCKNLKINYKQGLNYLFAPVFLLVHDMKKRLVMGERIITRLTLSLYMDDDFGGLQCIFRMFHLLIKYHDPELYFHLEKYGMKPELYAMPWFMTLMSNKLPMEILYYMWDYFLIESKSFKQSINSGSRDDGRFPGFHIFVFLALLISKRSIILSTDDMIPEVLNNLTILSIEEVDVVITHAKFIIKATPNSVITSISEILDLQRLPETSPIYHEVMNYHSLPVSISDVVNTIYTENLHGQKPGFEDKLFHKPIIVDCRNVTEFLAGHIEGSIHLDPELYETNSTLTEFLDEIHLDFQTQVYIIGSSSSNFEITVQEFLAQRFIPYVASVNGGYEELHQWLRRESALENVFNHNPQLCLECKEPASSSIRMSLRRNSLLLLEKCIDILTSQNVIDSEDFDHHKTYMNVLLQHVVEELLEIPLLASSTICAFSLSEDSYQCFQKTIDPYIPAVHFISYAIEFKRVMTEELLNENQEVKNFVRRCYPLNIDELIPNSNLHSSDLTIVLYYPILNFRSMAEISEFLETLSESSCKEISRALVVVCSLSGQISYWEKLHRLFSPALPRLLWVCGTLKPLSLDQ